MPEHSPEPWREASQIAFCGWAANHNDFADDASFAAGANWHASLPELREVLEKAEWLANHGKNHLCQDVHRIGIYCDKIAAALAAYKARMGM